MNKPERGPRIWHWILLILVLCIASGAAGVYFTLALASADLGNWGSYARDFAKSPGAAGCAAVAAAVIAYFSIRRQVAVSSSTLDHQRQVASTRAWWETFQWASGRAMPSGEKDQPLPDSVTISTLHSLTKTATDDVQKVACAGMIEVLTPRVVSSADEPQEAKETPEQDETAAFNALASYVMATDGTTAASPKAEAAVYERKVLAAFANLSADIRAFRGPQIGDSAVDAVAEVSNVQVAVQVTFARTPRPFGRVFAVTFSAAGARRRIHSSLCLGSLPHSRRRKKRRCALSSCSGTLKMTTVVCSTRFVAQASSDPR